jgi:predicted Zn-dependent protease
VEQLKLARDAGDADFYTLSEVDARLHQMERQYRWSPKHSNESSPSSRSTG